MIHSYGGRNINLVTISSTEGILEETESKIHPLLFPNNFPLGRAVKFRNNKMVVLITARVHPGESPSSHCANGIIKFLLSKKDARAYFLRKYFVFMIIPMLNPDGVFHGHYRMDILGQNLNRYYDFPNQEKQPSCFAVRFLVEYLEKDKRLFFFSDLHSHPRKQGCFFYGNAVDSFIEQVESQLYAKIVNMNTINFEYEQCNFSKKHMTIKDKNEDITKESSARVQVQKMTNIIHCYTLETGYHQNNFISELPHPNNIQRKFQGQYLYTEQDCESFSSDIYKRGPPLYNIQIYEQIGKAMMISILDIFDKNPYSRIPSTHFKSLEGKPKAVFIQ